MLKLYQKKFKGSQQEKVLKIQSILKDYYKKTIEKKSKISKKNDVNFKGLFEINKLDVEKAGSKNCENLIGSVEVPVGVAGPCEVGVFVDKSEKKSKKLNYVLPLATTEGALVASVSRGMKALNLAKNTKVFVKKIGMTRAPVFMFEDHQQALKFEQWLQEKKVFKEIKQACEATSNHLKLKEYQVWVRGKAVYVRLIFDTDQAMGMNMVTIAIRQAWDQKINHYPGIKLISLSSNICADKKTSAINKLFGRGYRVQVETKLSAEVLLQVLHVDAISLFQTYYWKNIVGSNLAGSTSINMHVANMVAAIFLATGQDMAHVVEASQADLLMEIEGDGNLYVALDLLNVNVGVVGGGTGLKPFVDARKLILGREISSEELAAGVGLGVLAGEISGLVALTSHTLACAHQKLAR